ncbi:50S ribosomal protein L5 [Candidatus Azambacteria bacterium]|nr:50S ribosomal protein L5 [Candidatus Azambacteria bacterium]
MNRLKEKYEKEIVKKLKQEFGLENDFEVPKVQKVIINSGTGRISKDTALVDSIVSDLTAIAGQKAVKAKAKKSIAAFKLREGTDVGVRVTLRGEKMYDFIDRLVSISLPRTRDFRGLDTKNIDEHGNLTIGIKEQIVFPEINKDSARGIFGLQVTVVTTNKNREVAERLYRLLGFPLKKEEK